MRFIFRILSALVFSLIGLSAADLSKMPLAFEKREGGGFVARGPGFTAGVDGGRVSMGPVAVSFAGSKAGVEVAGEKLPGKVNLIRGNDPKKWRTGIATYGRVSYSGIYSGIDVVYYGDQRRLEFDFVVGAGADPAVIRMRVEGGGGLAIGADGELRVGDMVRIALPKVYQEVDGHPRTVAGRFVLRGLDEVGFALGEYDKGRALTIDPTIVYSTMMPGGYGSGGVSAAAIAVDSAGNTIFAGAAGYSDYPTVNAIKNDLAAPDSDGFVTKLNASGTAILYSTFVGGNAEDQVNGVAVDRYGAVWLTGYTYSSDFPLLNATQSTRPSAPSAFAMKLDASGALAVSTYLGGGVSTFGQGVAVDSAGNVYVTGFYTAIKSQPAFPTTAGAMHVDPGVAGCFVAKYLSGGTQVYAATFGGSGSDAAKGIAVDSAGNAYVTGRSTSSSFTGAPTTGAQPQNAGANDAFVAKINAGATDYSYFTFFGGSGDDYGGGIAVDAGGNAVVSGGTTSSGLATAGAAISGLTGYSHGFLAKLNPGGTAFTYMTYLGGNRFDTVAGLTLDASGNVYVAGSTDSSDLPVVNAMQAAIPGNTTSLSKSSDTGATWTPFESGLQGAAIDVSPHPSDPLKLVVLAESGVFRSTDGGSTWTQTAVMPFATALGRSPVSTGLLYAAFNGGQVSVSTDDGVTWSAVTTVNFKVDQLVASPTSASTVYAFSRTSSYSNFYQSTNGGATWKAASLTGLPAAENFQSLVAVSDGTYYLAVASGIASRNGLFKSTDGGGTWASVSAGLPAGLHPGQHSIAVAGTTIYYAQGGVYRSTDAGANWTLLATAPDSAGIAVSSQDRSVFYAITTAGTLQSTTDGGATWSADATGLPKDLDLLSSAFAIASPSARSAAYVVTAVNRSAYVAKLKADGSGFLWLSYLGSSGVRPTAIALGANAGEIHIAGNATLPGLPLTANHLPSSLSGPFVMKVSDDTAACSFALNSAGLTVGGARQRVTIDVAAASGCAWSATSNQTWAGITDGASGAGTGAATVTLAANATGVARTATINIGNQSIGITQADSACSYSTDQASYAVDGTGGNVSVQVIAGVGCPWRVTNTHPGAVRILSGASGVSNGTIVFAVSLNPTQGTRSLSMPLTVNTAIRIVQPPSFAQSQTIDFGPLPDRNYFSIPPPLQATASSGLAVGFSSLTPTICQVFGTSIGGKKLGTCTIEATQAGDAIFKAAPAAAQSFQIQLNAPSVAMSHVGNFAQGQTNATYRVLVTNTSVDTLSGPVPIIASFRAPSGMKITGLGAQAGWQCDLAALTCSQNSSLTVVYQISWQPGTSAPPITMTVAVDSSAAALLTPQVALTLNGGSGPSASDSTTVVPALSDISNTDYFYDAVNFLREYGITAGCSTSPPLFCPNDRVTRAQVAIFVIRGVLGGDNFPYSGSPHFTDVGAEVFGFKWIQKMYELGITAGCGGGKYCPTDSITRGQTAIFITRARLGASSDSSFTYPATASFTDVPPAHPFFKWIQRMKSDGVTGGCGTTSYCPDDFVTRGQLALFLARGAFNQFLPGGTPTLASVGQAIFPVGTTARIPITGANTHFANGTTSVSAGPGVSVSNLGVADAKTLYVQFTIAADAGVGKRTIVVTTGSEEAVLPNGLTVK